MKLTRDLVKDAAPWAIHALHLWHRAANQVRYPVVASALELQSAGRVMGGPFEGLRAPHSGISPGHYTQLLGLYEEALAPAILGVIARQPSLIVDVGSHWGYYALGLAMRCPRSRVVAYEADRLRAQLLRRYSRLNRVGDRVEVRGACSVESLAADFSQAANPFLLMDVEGAEDVLLDPVGVPGLRRAEIIVEVHDALVPGVTERLRAAFASTHRQTPLSEKDADIVAVMAQLGVNHRLFRRATERLMDVGRDAQTSWLHLMPHAQHAGTIT